MIDLQANFRSRGPLLEAINGVFRRLMTLEAADIDYNDSHELTAGLTFPDAGGLPCFHRLAHRTAPAAPKLGSGAADGDEAGDERDARPRRPDLDRTEREAVLVARRIRQIVGLDGSPRCRSWKRARRGMQPAAGPAARRGHPARSMRYKADQFADVLRRCGVADPQRERHRVLRVGRGPRHARPAGRAGQPAAGHPAGGRAAQPAGRACPSRRRRWRESACGMPRSETPVPFHEAVVRYAAGAGRRTGRAPARVPEHGSHGWRLTAQRRPLAETIWSIYEQTGYLAFVSGLAGGEQRVANLLHLHERAARSSAPSSGRGCSRFLEFLENLRAESDLGEPSVATEAEDVVRVMSIHRSKGLEFPVVVLPDLGKKINLQDCEGSILVDRRAGWA